MIKINIIIGLIIAFSGNVYAQQEATYTKVTCSQEDSLSFKKEVELVGEAKLIKKEVSKYYKDCFTEVYKVKSKE
jgi:hypothetical protein